MNHRPQPHVPRAVLANLIAEVAAHPAGDTPYEVGWRRGLQTLAEALRLPVPAGGDPAAVNPTTAPADLPSALLARTTLGTTTAAENIGRAAARLAAAGPEG